MVASTFMIVPFAECNLPGGFLQKQFARRAVPARVGIGEKLADVAFSQRAQNGIANGMHKHVRIGMPLQALPVGNVHTAQDQFAARRQWMHIISDSGMNHLGRTIELPGLSTKQRVKIFVGGFLARKGRMELSSCFIGEICEICVSSMVSDRDHGFQGFPACAEVQSPRLAPNCTKNKSLGLSRATGATGGRLLILLTVPPPSRSFQRPTCMINLLIKKIVGSQNERQVKKMRPLVSKINEIEAALQSVARRRAAPKDGGLEGGVVPNQGRRELALRLEEILPEAYAVVKNACRRLCGQDITVRDHPLKWEMIPFDVQLIGGIALHRGKIAEMATGEGKTLVATMPVYLNALTGRGVHVVTVNDYLAARDSEWMGAVYRFLGLTVGCILRDQSPAERRAQYDCDITYGTNAEFGFDYLRDNGMATRKEEQVQRGHYFAIVDEVDSILIDEARTPLIISGPSVIAVDNQVRPVQAAVESLVRAQEKLCARFISEAEELIKKLHPADGSNPSNPAALEHEIGMLLYRVKMGSPRSPGLMKLLEEPGKHPPDEQGGIGIARRPKQKGALRGEGGTVLRHGRKNARGRPDGKGPQFHAPGGPGRLRAAGFDGEVPRDRFRARRPTRANGWK